MRLFLGFTPTLAQRQIYSLCERLEFPDSLPLRWVPPENWHVTLVFLGDVPELPATRAMLMRACDVRLPVRLTRTELDIIADILLDAMAEVTGALAA